MVLITWNTPIDLMVTWLHYDPFTKCLKCNAWQCAFNQVWILTMEFKHLKMEKGNVEKAGKDWLLLKMMNLRRVFIDWFQGHCNNLDLSYGSSSPCEQWVRVDAVSAQAGFIYYTLHLTLGLAK
ncbi:hypothetical protein HGM15179_000989 [Zosterops borbonicus]|uniref:Uncharacterized protein n=1 Tax=Zosterops borbonicus TaxID=364589 RepID=A0A8K1GYS6_9PASS|nr:hypothetical protein HGM15179_000989 [Zosterops borbonicus]